MRPERRYPQLNQLGRIEVWLGLSGQSHQHFRAGEYEAAAGARIGGPAASRGLRRGTPRSIRRTSRSWQSYDEDESRKPAQATRLRRGETFSSENGTSG